VGAVWREGGAARAGGGGCVQGAVHRAPVVPQTISGNVRIQVILDVTLQDVIRGTTGRALRRQRARLPLEPCTHACGWMCAGPRGSSSDNKRICEISKCHPGRHKQWYLHRSCRPGPAVMMQRRWQASRAARGRGERKATHQVQLAPYAVLLEGARHRGPHLAQVLLWARQGQQGSAGVSKWGKSHGPARWAGLQQAGQARRAGTTGLMHESSAREPPTPVLGEERREGALLEQAMRVVLLAEGLHRPVVDAVVVPGLLLPMLRAETGREPSASGVGPACGRRNAARAGSSAPAAGRPPCPSSCRSAPAPAAAPAPPPAAHRDPPAPPSLPPCPLAPAGRSRGNGAAGAPGLQSDTTPISGSGAAPRQQPGAESGGCAAVRPRPDRRVQGPRARAAPRWVVCSPIFQRARRKAAAAAVCVGPGRRCASDRGRGAWAWLCCEVDWLISGEARGRWDLCGPPHSFAKSRRQALQRGHAPAAKTFDAMHLHTAHRAPH
jgi:hypothetical protein